mmetsp:Transcript_6434/g.11773  ORF Transcript_6434/g.11773 Transcript_6434/m.11773 type:complete len:503 (-) Transcript_6434:60-1568(-)
MRALCSTALRPVLAILLGLCGLDAVSSEPTHKLEEALSSLFPALPKTSRGTLRPTTAKYALQRLFSRLYGWQLGQGAALPVSESSISFGANVTQWLQAHSEEGLNLADLATLAHVLEEMVHEEAEARLVTAFRATGKPTHGLLKLNESTAILETYMASFVLGVEIAELHADSMSELVAEVPEQYPTWPATQEFLQEVHRATVSKTGDISFRDLSRVVSVVDERYGWWQSHECKALKSELLQIEEHPHTGRVRLSDFYGRALKGGQWQFSESTSYLRQMGALDETDPQSLRVVIPNYMLSLSNCIAASSYYMVCCINECDLHLDQLEQALGSYQAPAEDILLALNQSVAPSLQRRLKDIAEHHSGMVPLHGRLFAQWLHHLHPHDCPYPHMSGTTSPLQPAVFEEEMGQSAEASQEEMLQHVEAAPWRAPPTHEDGMCSHMWSMEEELIDPAAHVFKDQSQAFGAQRLAAALAALCLFSAFSTLAKSETGKPRPERSLPVYSV